MDDGSKATRRPSEGSATRRAKPSDNVHLIYFTVILLGIATFLIYRKDMDEPVPHTPLTKKLEPSYDYIIGEKI
jgi:hypothetical protein